MIASGLDGGGDDGLGSLSLFRRPIRIEGRERLTLGGEVLECIVGLFRAFRMGFKEKNANVTMTPFTTGCFANRTNEFERRVLLNHLTFLLPLHLKKMVNIEQTANYPLSPWT